MKNKIYSQTPATNQFAWKPAALLLTGLMIALPAQALVHLNPHASLYQNRPTTAPADTLPWDNVGKMTNAAGTGMNGTVVSLHGKYVLTADHVVQGTHVSFDGVTLYAIDGTFTPVTFATTHLAKSHPDYRRPDLKLFKLVEDPELESLAIADYSYETHSYAPMYNVGWGFGKLASQTAPNVNSNGNIEWSRSTDASTRIKRWGTTSNPLSTTISPNSAYTYNALSVRLNSNPPPALSSEAGITDKDSGGPAFTHRDGQWYLVGIATGATSSTFSRFSPGFGHANYWVDLHEFRDQIYTVAPMEPEPEPEPDLSTFEGWLLANALEGADAAADADPDGDGMANLSEFAYGTNPTVHDGAKAPALVANGSGGFVFRYQLSKVAAGINVDVLHSADVINWSLTPGTPVIVEDNADVAVYELEVFPSPTTERFYTVKVTLESETE